MDAVLLRFLETYFGSSFPTRSETTRGELLVKMRGAGNGVSSLLSEFLINRIAVCAGLPVPNVCCVQIPTDFPWTFGTDEFHDIVAKSTGENLGIDLIAGAKPVRVDEYNKLPADLVSQIVTLDLTFSNIDRSITSNNLLQDRAGNYWIVDHGSSLFLHQERVTAERCLPANHAFAGWEFAYDRRWLERLTPEMLETVISIVPKNWLLESVQTAENVSSRLRQRILPRKSS